MTLEELTAQRNALLAARFRGVRTVETEGRRVTFATDAEMAAAIINLERRIAATQDGGRRRRNTRQEVEYRGAGATVPARATT